MELLWQNGEVVMQSQSHRPMRKPPPLPPSRISGGAIPAGTSIRPEAVNYNNTQNLFMQEDGITSWLHYPMDDPPLDQTFCTDLLYAPPPTVNANNHKDDNNNSIAMQKFGRNSQLTELRKCQKSVASRPPIPPPRRTEQAAPANTSNFSKHNAITEPGPSSSSRNIARESTMVDSCDTPFLAAEAAVSRFSEQTEGDGGRKSMSAATTSSPGGSSSSGEIDRKLTAEDRKRKGRVEAVEWESQSEDVDFESAEAKKQIRGSSTKRSRAAEVHNLSERKRRDRINEKMRALQELIPRCNKSDKASMLDDAIEYLKSLQLQVQMMSMGCGMVPMMFAGMHPYMPAMAMGMGMGMDMGMNRPVMPFPNVLAGSALPAATAAAHLGPRFPMPPFHMPHVPAPDSSQMQATNQSDNSMLNSVGTPVLNQSCIPNFNSPYQYLGPHQMQFQLMQNQAMNQLNVNKPSTSRAPENPEHHQSAALLGQLEFCEVVLDIKPSLAIEVDSEGRCPLHLASFEGHIKVVKSLLFTNSDVCFIRDKDGNLPIHLAVSRGHIGVIEELIIAKPESIGMITNDGSVLHLCVMYNHFEALNLLLQLVRGSQQQVLNFKDKEGNTVLHLAVRLRHIKTIKHLLSLPEIRKAANTLNKAGHTVLDMLDLSQRDFISLIIEQILIEVGAQRSTNIAITYSQNMANEVESHRQSRWKRLENFWSKYLQYQGNWIEETRGTLMVVATVIATMTFQSALNPPGGVWQENTQSGGNKCTTYGICEAGTAVVGYVWSEDYIRFMAFNTISFYASLSVVLVLINGFPLKNKVIMWILTIVMTIAVTFMFLTYMWALGLVTPHHIYSRLYKLAYICVGAWGIILIVIGLIQTAQLVFWIKNRRKNFNIGPEQV
ncbi:hypothetical protein TanjilG_28329 [Lupinus angustifolius]|uniref:BHLH domain-containing protein n=1 Tax=Lupinus angustifolius TaxID=3871 RepID=A0A4P1RI32_LUPAN|nr:hypothetical protein TanjilG_28329 [Lupinus angustifolius]